ncbi:MAG: ABC transporter substrate-binding protein [Acidimicrobiales bacterium]
MRRKALALVLILGFIAAACGGDDDDTSPAAQPSAQPNLEAEVRVAAPEDQWPDNGPDAKSWQFMYVHNMNVYEPLVYLGSDYTLQPGLAERWELQPDGKTWRFFLRRNVRFQDGAPFSADDVVWSWGVRQLEGKVLTTVTNTLGPESVKKVDDFTVDFTPAQQNLRIPEQIVHPEGAIVKNGTHNDTPPYAGTGPWKVVSYTPKQNAVFERNEDYWGEKPKVKRINIRFLPDPQTRLEALRAKQVDFVIDLPADATAAVESDPNWRVVKSAPGRNHLIYVNKKEGRITAEAAVREAVNYAINRRAYVDVVLEGNGEPGRWMAPKSVLGPTADTVAAIPLDLGRARKILDDAGWRVGPDGVRTKGDKRLSLILLGQFEVPESALLVIQSNLKEAGMEVTLKKTPDAATRNALYDRGNGDFDLDIEPPNQNDGNPAFLPVLRMYSKGTNTVQFAPNSPPITPNGPEFDAQAEKALAAKTTPEVQQASAAMMRILSNQDHIVVPLAGVYRIYGMAKNVNLGDPHPSFTNQRWVSLTMSSSN